MLDRGSTFANTEMIEMLNADFVAVALDQAYQRRQRDAEGEFYRRIAGQGPRSDFKRTTQGFYVATANGELLLYNNNRDPAKVRRLVRDALKQFRASDSAKADVAAVERGAVDNRYSPSPPDGGLVVRVHARVLGGYAAPRNRWHRIRQTALSRDNFWITKAEREALTRGKLATSLTRRLARFHLVDGTRGEPPMWKDDEVHDLDVKLEGGRLHGTFHLETGDKSRAFHGELLGHVEKKRGQVTRFDVIASGTFRGEGRYTPGAPEGDFPFAVRFTLADGEDTADAIPPQGSRGWVQGYIRQR